MRTVRMMLVLAGVAVGTVAVQPRALAAAKPAPKAKPAKPAAKSDAKLPKKAVCAVCSVKEGKKELEPVKASLKYKGKTYYFCNLDEKAEFISNPAKYAGAGK